MSNMQIPNSIWTPSPFYMTNMDPPPFHMTNMSQYAKKYAKYGPPPFYIAIFWKYVEYNCFLKSQIGPYPRGKAQSEISTICKICKICWVCKICIVPRTRWAGLRSNAAVDIFGRGTAVTLTLFSSGNAEQAVPCRNQIDVIMEFTLRICRLKYAQYAQYAEYDQYVVLNMITICRICRICRICNMTNMSNMQVPNSIWTPTLFIWQIWTPPPQGVGVGPQG